MPRSVTLFTGQWADLPLTKLAKAASEMEFDGLELCCWGDHLDVFKAAKDKKYCAQKRAMLKRNKLECFAISNHYAGQLVCDPNDDSRSDAFAPEKCVGNSEKKREWAVRAMKTTAKAARNLGVDVVNGFVGSSIWHLLYSFPPVPSSMIDEGYKYFADMWNPILDEFDKQKVRFALEVHPTEIAFDIASAERTLDALDNRETFGFSYDPSHLGYQGVDYVKFIRHFRDRIYHVQMKDCWWGHGDGSVGVFGGHTEFGDHRRYWDFRSVGRGDIMFEDIIVALNDIGYTGPLSVEWEDIRMERIDGASESCQYVKALDYKSIGFDDVTS
ncbi:MAG: sugar phosphate isomerase/epimerase [Verrucomicrobiota bacterium]